MSFYLEVFVSSTYCAGGIEIADNFFSPEFYYIHRHLGSLYQENPTMARLIATPLAMLSGMTKVLLAPVISAVGTIAMPIIALTLYWQGKENSGDWLQAWYFCLLGVGLSIACLTMLSSVPMVYSTSVLALAVSLSIVIHVHKAVQIPTDLESEVLR